MIIFKCSECGGKVDLLHDKYVCRNCKRSIPVLDSNTTTIDMSETANLEVIMEGGD